MNREIIRLKCVDDDWLKIGKPVPSETYRYVLCKCNNCGMLIPTDKRYLKDNLKRCSFCSGIGHRSTLKTTCNKWSFINNTAQCTIKYKGASYNFIIDMDDYKLVSTKQWRLSKKKEKLYVITGSRKDAIYLHHLIKGKPIDGLEIDHINGNSLDNRKCNLRFLSRSDNARFIKAKKTNQLGIRGISKNKNKYIVDFSYDNMRFYFKNFNDFKDAVYCRKFAEERFGLTILKNNPLSKKYLTYDKEKELIIKRYTNDIIDKQMGECKCKLKD